MHYDEVLDVENKGVAGTVDLTVARDGVELLKSSKNMEQWNRNVNKIKIANGQKYPSYWFAKVHIPNLFDTISLAWETPMSL